MSALARARAIDVTSVLASSALVTWLLQLVVGTTSVSRDAIGLALIGAGATLVLVEARGRASWSERALRA
jgi:hypothetical protein